MLINIIKMSGKQNIEIWSAVNRLPVHPPPAKNNNHGAPTHINWWPYVILCCRWNLDTLIHTSTAMSCSMGPWSHKKFGSSGCLLFADVFVFIFQLLHGLITVSLESNSKYCLCKRWRYIASHLKYSWCQNIVKKSFLSYTSQNWITFQSG